MQDNSLKSDPWQEAQDFGIDTQMLKENLKLSYDQRAIRHQQALDNLNLLLEAKKQHEKSQQSDSSITKV